ncbi:uncharacterized protein LOC107273694 isoform X2 [Cephus cinctus]|nr:uncharacterized protein LOC107273694 isoform X2 [Cephus cinctus]
MKNILFVCSSIITVTGVACGWNLGNGFRYQLTTTVLFEEVGPMKFSDVGFQVTGELIVIPLWKDPNDANTILLKIE